MKTFYRQLTRKDLEYKGFPFGCNNCGNHPTPQQVIDNAGEFVENNLEVID
jgi:hypothetical protein